MAQKDIVIFGIPIGAVLTIIVYLYVAGMLFHTVSENPEPFIDAGEALVETAPKILDAVNTMCKIDEMFTNAIDSPLLNNVPEDAKEVLLLLKNGTEIDVCQAKILEEMLSASQKHKINFKKLGCNIADCLN